MHRIVGLLQTPALSAKAQKILLLYVALLFLSFHWSLVVYINSSFLGQFFTSPQISALYAVGSILSLLCFFFAPSILKSIGNYRLTFGFTLLELTALFGMAFATTQGAALFYFLLHFAVVPLILFNFDVLLEEATGPSEQKTGSLYGLRLSLLTLASAVSQLVVGSLIDVAQSSFVFVYIVSALCLLPFFGIIHLSSRRFKDPSYIPLSLRTMIETLKKDVDTRKIVAISFILQLFFATMVIFTPLYLSTVIGFSWTQIGAILFVGLMAYVLFEWPIGIIADKYIGEKEMMAFGFVIMALSISWFAFISSASLVLWMVAMFLSRVGASLVETTTESYFFKHAQSIDTHKISLFRMTAPLAFIASALLGSVALMFIPLNLFFILIAFLMIPGLFITLFITDTR
jgi:MFS family permease